MRARALLLLVALSAASWAFDETPTSAVPTATPTTLSQTLISVNKAPYQNNASAYYLGYHPADYEKPFAKYFNPHVAPISAEVEKGITMSPYAAALAYEAHEAVEYMLRPGYLELENGYAVTENGTLMIAVRTDMGNVTGEEYNWWFGWHLVESARYKLWNPVAHQYAWRYPNSLDWANKTYPERYFNTFSFIDEYLGNDAYKLTVAFIDPSELGFDPSKFAEHNIETMVVAHIHSGSHIISGFDNRSFLIHQLRRKPDGSSELRSRFWLAEHTSQVAHDLTVHCNIEMTHLSSFLPALFQEFRDTI